MIYRGFTIRLERQTCEFFDLDNNGDAQEYVETCYAEEHQGICEFVAFNADDGQEFIGASDLDTLKAYIDKALDKANEKLLQTVAS